MMMPVSNKTTTITSTFDIYSLRFSFKCIIYSISSFVFLHHHQQHNNIVRMKKESERGFQSCNRQFIITQEQARDISTRRRWRWWRQRTWRKISPIAPSTLSPSFLSNNINKIFLFTFVSHRRRCRHWENNNEWESTLLYMYHHHHDTNCISILFMVSGGFFKSSSHLSISHWTNFFLLSLASSVYYRGRVILDLYLSHTPLMQLSKNNFTISINCIFRCVIFYLTFQLLKNYVKKTVNQE